jgi:hypothetical protein
LLKLDCFVITIIGLIVGFTYIKKKFTKEEICNELFRDDNSEGSEK